MFGEKAGAGLVSAPFVGVIFLRLRPLQVLHALPPPAPTLGGDRAITSGFTSFTPRALIPSRSVPWASQVTWCSFSSMTVSILMNFRVVLLKLRQGARFTTVTCEL